jgi:hypothetical protein
VTLDGIRLKELFQDPPAMPCLMQDLLPRGSFIGSDSDPPDMRIGSPVGVSMSGYYSIFSGRMTACFDNEDPPPRGTTLISDLVAAFPGAVALFSTWGLIVQRQQEIAPDVAAVAGRDAARAYLKERGIELPEDAPLDTPIFRAGLTCLQQDAPRFLYIGLDETDDAAHRNDYERYQRVLARFDGFLAELVAEIDAQAARGRKITLIVTTDHGRGRGAEWVEHRWNIQGTARIWLFAMGHGIKAQGHLRPRQKASHYDLRPTLSYLLGIRPKRRFWTGRVIEALLSR